MQLQKKDELNNAEKFSSNFQAQIEQKDKMIQELDNQIQKLQYANSGKSKS